MDLKNPFRPGAGHSPPYLAGRTSEQEVFKRFLAQPIVSQNVIVTGLRGVGKTVLLDTFQPIAVSASWLWAGTDLSESASLTEERLATRILADISRVTSATVTRTVRQYELGFTSSEKIINQPLSYEVLQSHFAATPGLVSDKLKAVLEFVWDVMPKDGVSGIVFAYDEAQNLADHAQKDEYPLSLLLEVFQSLQRKQLPFLLVLSGLPTLFPKLVDARTYAERMFHVMFLKQLTPDAAREAIVRPIIDQKCPIKFSEPVVSKVVEVSGCYPYFIQFICKEIYDVWISKITGGEVPSVPVNDIIRKLDNDFFSGRWANVTDRQRVLLQVISTLENCDSEFTVAEVVQASKDILVKPFTASHVNQMLVSLADTGLVYKNRYGRYSLAVPLLGEFIRRQSREAADFRGQ
jgi:hypothetical protein